MDKITLQGKVYERSSVVAKRHGYTADYMGQLSRSGKVDAELVGRSWYVYSPSVETYMNGLEEEDCEDVVTAKDGEAQKSDAPKVASDEQSYSIPVHVESAQGNAAKPKLPPEETDLSASRKDEIINNKSISRSDHTVKSSPPKPHTFKSESLLATASVAAPQQTYKRWSQVAYESDETELVPDLAERTKATAVPEPSAFADASARPIRVHSTNDQYSIVTSQVPAVRLRGKITISESEEDPNDSDYKEAATAVQQRIREYNHDQKVDMVTKTSTPKLSAVAMSVPGAVVTQPDTVEIPEEPEAASVPVPATRIAAWRLAVLVIVLLIGAGLALSILFLDTITTYDSDTQRLFTGVEWRSLGVWWSDFGTFIRQ